MEFIKMNIQVIAVKTTEKELLKNLYSLYLYDLTQYDNKLNLSSNGLYEFQALDVFFEKNTLKPYFIKVNRKLVGFLLLTGGGFSPEDSDWGIEDLFIIRSERRKGIASKTIRLIMDKYKGEYSIFQFQKNIESKKFWYAFYDANSIKYTEIERMENGKVCTIQNFKM